ncbi:MAG: hypothetical protein DMG02_01070 [Acidobacteria bacterium]|nr:MAG: hypothetical protein DMG02_01070 [Acidobacteriota bacterium]
MATDAEADESARTVRAILRPCAAAVATTYTGAIQEHSLSLVDAPGLLELLERSLTREPKGAGRAAGPPVAWASTRGLVRKENQDRVAVARSASGLIAAILADGMGGMRDGARAAIIATATMAARCAGSSAGNVEAVLKDAFRLANEQVFRALRGEGGAAVVAAAWSAGAWFVAHAGDARAYHLDSSGPPTRLTVDDTLQAQLEDMGRAAERGSASERRLLQFVGMGKDFEPHVAAVPGQGRGLILTSDGAHSLPPPVLEWVAVGAGHLQMLAERLVTASEWNGGHDNATVLTISFQNGPAPQQEGVAEFWVPGDHLMAFAAPAPRVPAAAAGPVVSPPAPIPEPKPKRSSDSRRSKSRKRTGRTERKQAKGTVSTSEAVPAGSGRQLPIVTFEDAGDDPNLERSAPAEQPKPDAIPPGSGDKPEN